MLLFLPAGTVVVVYIMKVKRKRWVYIVHKDGGMWVRGLEKGT